MSYDDPNRNYNGQFNYLPGGANTYEQSQAGVNSGDTLFNALAKVDGYRALMGLDSYGNPKPIPPPPIYYGGGSATDGRQPIDENLTWRVLSSVFLWIILAPAALAGACYGALVAAKALDGPTLARRASASEFSAFALSPPSSYLTAKQIDAPINPKKLLADFHRSLPSKKADPARLRSKVLIEQAYQCLMQPGCRLSMSKLDHVAAGNLSYVAAGVFVPRIAKGDESAARDMCILSIVTGDSYHDALMAPTLCSQALHTNPKSMAAHTAMSQLDSSWALRLARAYKWAD